MPNNENYISSIIFDEQIVPIKQNLENPISIAGTEYSSVAAAVEALASTAGVQVNSLPTASASELNKIYQYTGATENGFTKGYFYICIYDSSDDEYKWEEIRTQAEETITVDSTLSATSENPTQNAVITAALATKATQYTTLPVASEDNLGKVVQFIGTTTSELTNGYFYKCVSDGEDPATYSWEQVNVQPTEIYCGYYYNSKFYEEAAYTTEITAIDGAIYIDISTNTTYRYNFSSTSYEKISGFNWARGYYFSDAFWLSKIGTTYSNYIPKDTKTIYIDVSTSTLYVYNGSNFITIGGFRYVAGDGISIDSSTNTIKVVNRLIEVEELPTLTTDIAGNCYLLTGKQTGYQTGAIYQAAEDGNTTTVLDYEEGNYSTFNNCAALSYSGNSPAVIWTVKNGYVVYFGTSPSNMKVVAEFRQNNSTNTITVVYLSGETAIYSLRIGGVGQKLYMSYDTFGFKAINEASTDTSSKVNFTDFAPAFSTSTAYAIGDYVIYNNNIYKCTAAHTAGAWDNTHFTQIAITDELGGSSYTAGTGISIDNETINHSNSVTAGTAGTSSATSGATVSVPYVTYDGQGHITASGTHTHTIGSLNTSAITAGTLPVTRGGTGNTSVDTTPTSGSTKMVTSGGLFTALKKTGAYYGTCTTAGDTAAKVVTCSTFTSASLAAGTIITILFTYAPTANTATQVTLNINSTGAKNIRQLGNNSVYNNASLWSDDDYVTFIYNGTYWIMLQNGRTASVSSRNASHSPSAEQVYSFVTNNTIPSSDLTFWFDSDIYDMVKWVSDNFTGGGTSRITGGFFRGNSNTDDFDDYGDGRYILWSGDDLYVCSGIAITTEGMYYIYFDEDACTLSEDPFEDSEEAIAYCQDHLYINKIHFPYQSGTISADDITAWSAGTTPTLGTAIAADDITAWNAGSATVTSGVLTFTKPSLSYTARSIPNVTNVGTTPSLTYTAKNIPNIIIPN